MGGEVGAAVRLLELEPEPHEPKADAFQPPPSPAATATSSEKFELLELGLESELALELALKGIALKGSRMLSTVAARPVHCTHKFVQNGRQAITATRPRCGGQPTKIFDMILFDPNSALLGVSEDTSACLQNAVGVE